MENFIKNKSTSEILFHEFMRCMHLIRFSMHRCGGMGHGHHRGMGKHHFGGFGGLKDIDMQKIGQGRLLSFLLEKDGINQKELAELLRIAPASVSELVNKLESGGYIEKRQNESDKRITNIFLTEGGRFFSQKMEEERSQLSKNIFTALSEEEQKQLLTLIQKLINSLSNENEDEDFRCHRFGFAEGRE
ncbi:MAG: MarR family transcriptional regulator [Candidatus Gastranaerophilaceae bacterium]|jgi:DNA-binding MarR family transcriptional regulator